MLNACGGGSAGTESAPEVSSHPTGTVSFDITWQDRMNGDSLHPIQAPGNDVCNDYGINEINCKVYNNTGTIVGSETWPCSEHEGLMSGIPAGSGMWLIIEGLVSETVEWKGQSAPFVVTQNETTVLDAVSIYHIESDAVRPEIDVTTPTDGIIDVSLNAVITAKFTEDVTSTTVITAFTVMADTTAVAGTVAYDATTWTATFTPEADLTASTEYTATISSTVEDLAGLEMADAYIWTFTTAASDAPSVTTQPATEVTHSTAKLNAIVNPNGLAATYDFAYGPDTTYGSTTEIQEAGSGDGPISISVDLPNLTPNTTYHYRVSATNAGGTTHGSDATFTTDKIWAKTYGPIDHYYSNGKVQLTSDGGYILFGYTSYFKPDGNPDIWISKLDADGEVIWEKTYHALGYESISAIEQVAAGGYIITGSTTVDIGEKWYGLIIKIDDNGGLQWSRQVDGVLGSVQQTSDGGFILAGTIDSDGSDDIDFWVVKMNPTGQITWQISYGGQLRDIARSVEQTSDGGYIVTGDTTSSGAGSHDCLAMKLNADGSVAWQNTYGGAGYDICIRGMQTTDDGFITAGISTSFGAGKNDVWVFKLDAQGNIQWQKAYGGEENDTCRSLQPTQNGGYVMIGTSTSFGESVNFNDGWILSIDANGAILWQKGFGGAESDYGVSIHQTPDGGFVAAGAGKSYKPTEGDMFADILLLKIGQNGSMGCGITYDTTASVFDSTANGAASDVTVSNTPLTTLSTNIEVLDATATVQSLCP